MPGHDIGAGEITGQEFLAVHGFVHGTQHAGQLLGGTFDVDRIALGFGQQAGFDHQYINVGHDHPLGIMQPLQIGGEIRRINLRPHAPVTVFGQQIFHDGAGFKNRHIAVRQRRHAGHGMDLEVFRVPHGTVAQLEHLQFIVQAQLLAQPDNADGSGIGRVIDFHGWCLRA